MTLTLRSDLPIKYNLNLHREEGLRDDRSILFDIIGHFLRVAQSKQKETSLDSFNFSSKTMKYVFGDRLKDETFKLELVKSIKQLISSGEILATGETMSVTEKGLLNFYLIR
jgi:hypothetical protein